MIGQHWFFFCPVMKTYLPADGHRGASSSFVIQMPFQEPQFAPPTARSWDYNQRRESVSHRRQTGVELGEEENINTLENHYVFV